MDHVMAGAMTTRVVVVMSTSRSAKTGIMIRNDATRPSGSP
jgi:hypothetical protein